MGKVFPCSALWLFQKAEGEFPVTGGSKLPCWDGGMSHVPGELGGPGRFQGLLGSAILNLCSLTIFFLEFLIFTSLPHHPVSNNNIGDIVNIYCTLTVTQALNHLL